MFLVKVRLSNYTTLLLNNLHFDSILQTTWISQADSLSTAVLWQRHENDTRGYLPVGIETNLATQDAILMYQNIYTPPARPQWLQPFIKQSVSPA